MMKKSVLLATLTLASIATQASSLSAVPNEQLQGQVKKTSKLKLTQNQATLKQVFEQVEAQTQQHFVYIAADIPVSKSYEFTTEYDSLETLLHHIAAKANVSFQAQGNQILVKPNTQVQERILEFKGKVVDQDGLPIIGANVRDKDNEFIAVTDLDGQFTLTVTKAPITLSFSFMGYKTKDLSFSKNNLNILVKLEEDNQMLSEIVVTGQGADVQKKRLANNVTVIKASELEKIPAQRVDQLLATKLPNAQINLTGGQAGSTSLIRSRGVNSAFLSSTPIIYVDGVRLDNNNTRASLGGSAQGASMSSIADIPMDNIEKIEFINGGAATTLYGSDAANGVIQIFTKKRGMPGTYVNVFTEMGVETPTTDFLYFDRTKDLLFENGFYQKYRLNLNGESDSGFGYNFSTSYQNSSGVQIHKQNENQKFDLSSGFHAKLSEDVTYESSFMYVHNAYKRNRNGNQGGYTGLWFAEDGASKITGPGFKNRLNELTDEEFAVMKEFVNNAERLQDNNITVNRFTTSQQFKYNPLENLSFKLVGGLDYRIQDQENIETNEYLTATKGQLIKDQGSIQKIQRKYLGLTVEFNGQHNINVGDFSFITTVGGQLFRNSDNQTLIEGRNIRDGAYSISEAAIRTSDEYISEVLNYGFYLSENVGYKDKLFLDVGVRGDRNPSFGKNIGVQYYPKVGVSYMMSQESWFANPLVNTLRLRGSYGVAGNLPPAYANEKTVAFDGYLGEQATRFSQPGNDDLRPEKTHTWETGIDASFWNNRLTLSVGYYYSKTKDALFYVPPAPSSGYTKSQLYNIGEIENKGFEMNFALEVVQTQDWNVSLTGSVNTLKNKVLSTGGAPAFNINGFSSRTLQTVVEEGRPVGFIRGNYGVIGEDGTLKETIPQAYLGSTIPEVFGNIGLNLRYKNWSLFANANYQTGGYAANWDAQFRYNYGASDDFVPKEEIDKNGRTNWLNLTNRFVEKTDYLKIRTIGLSYYLRPANPSLYQSITFGFTVANPFNFTASSFDPEATISGAAQGQGGASTGGIAYATYSAPRQFLGSIKINF
ncbi:TonB-dependent receptor domain-containing protein [Myroides odoratus]|uniref:TonB-dependent receptor domain-containing protein n=1 Tax=Myroides odoratus TaxID=256 RepID=UPI002169B0F9|nr:TonB-dependent receptor [Myroides odoratus]MCS4238009.1 outer membrane receptor protein involved in Fe transport [Myroides odoratus]MDH6600085.1 outer membrane receptor protein involved in Fe transport [Myroides gitamensis]